MGKFKVSVTTTSLAGPRLTMHGSFLIDSFIELETAIDEYLKKELALDQEFDSMGIESVSTKMIIRSGDRDFELEVVTIPIAELA